MRRNGRPIVSAFAPTERLYFRCMASWIEPDGTIKPANVHFPDQSVNREMFSKPCDVLLPDGTDRSKSWIHWGVATIRVENVPSSLSTAGNVTYNFTVEHDPLDDNYGHSELRVYKGGQRETNSNKVNAGVKKGYRTAVGLKSRVIISALI